MRHREASKTCSPRCDGRWATKDNTMWTKWDTIFGEAHTNGRQLSILDFFLFYLYMKFISQLLNWKLRRSVKILLKINLWKNYENQYFFVKIRKKNILVSRKTNVDPENDSLLYVSYRRSQNVPWICIFY